MSSIPYGKQWIADEDLTGVMDVLKSDWLTQGPQVKAFEENLCRYTGAKYAVALSNGTAALHAAMLALGVGKNDKTITSPITFAASANCALYVGAKPQFVDINDRTYHLDVERLKEFLKNPARRRRVKVIVPVHFMGTVSDVAAIKKLADQYGIKIVEDAAHALGAKYLNAGQWVKVGCSLHSDMTIFSFHPIKHITTGEGGVILTNTKKLYESVLRLRHHGIVKSKRIGWMYDIPELGFNFRITDFQCALGNSQLNRIEAIVQKRRRLVERYNAALTDLKGMRLPLEQEGTLASYHIYVVRVAGRRRDALYNFLREEEIFAQVNYIPVHLFSLYKKLGFKKGDFPVAEKYYQECLSLPLFPSLREEQQDKVIAAVRRFVHDGR